MLLGQLVRKDDPLELLVALIHEKTRENPHAVVQILEYLESKDLLYMTSKTNTWDLNMDGIKAEVSDNPSEIISSKINLLDGIVQEFLRLLAAFVGHTFEVDVLR
jgi:predicted ATPase